jgi:phosphohistidine phosphatase
VVQRISEKFPTSAIAVLTVAGEWKSVELNCASLIGFHVPR